MHGKLFHAGLVAENAALGALTRGVDSEHGKLAATLEQVQTEHINRCAFACARHTGYAYAARAARMRQALLDHLLGHGAVFGRKTLHEGDATREHGDVAFEDSFHQFGHRWHGPTAPTEIRVDLRRLAHAGIYGKTAELFVIFYMFHGWEG